MNREAPTARRGLGWLILMAIPPVAVIAGLVAVFVWQGSKGGITPKWKAKAASTNGVTGSAAATPAPH